MLTLSVYHVLVRNPTYRQDSGILRYIWRSRGNDLLLVNSTRI